MFEKLLIHKIACKICSRQVKFLSLCLGELWKFNSKSKLLAQSMPGGSMGHGFNYQLVMERCKQLSETDTNDSSTRKFRKISQKNVNVVDSSVKGLSSLF